MTAVIMSILKVEMCQKPASKVKSSVLIKTIT